MKLTDKRKAHRTSTHICKPRNANATPKACKRVCFFPTLGLVLIAIMILLTTNSFGQVPIVELPKPATFDPIINPTPNYPTPNIPQPNYPTTPNGLEIYEKDRQREMQRQRQLQEINRDIEEFNRRTIRYDLPSCASFQGTEAYRTAFNEISKMASGERNFSVKEANFIVENAYFDNKADFKDFDKIIKDIAQFVKWKMGEDGFNQNSNLAKNVMLYRFFADTLEIKSKKMITYPFKYDFEDYLGREDWTKMFVSKALATNSGQCHSLPLLYLILADEIGADAQLSFSPSHTYVKFQDDNGKWYNVELTNGLFTTDAFILKSGYIKAEALSNKIYMQPLNENQMMAHALYNLAKGYVSKFCYDSFVETVINKALELDPKNINAQMVLADYKTLRFQYVISQVKVPPQHIHKYPRAKALLDEMHEQYAVIDNFGYEDMPEEEYEKWLNSLNDAKQQQESREMLLDLKGKIENKTPEMKQ